MEIDIWDGRPPDSDSEDSSSEENTEKMGFREKWGINKDDKEREHSGNKWSTLKKRFSIVRKISHDKHSHSYNQTAKSGASGPTVIETSSTTARPAPWKPGVAEKVKDVVEPRVLHGRPHTAPSVLLIF